MKLAKQRLVGEAESIRGVRGSAEELRKPIVPTLLLKTCSKCKKGFSNGKALGGHMRVHNSDKYHHRQQPLSHGDLSSISFSFHQQDSPLCLLPDTAYSYNGGGSVKTSKNHPVGDAESQQRHVCSICFKEFRSTKSLCGHMRCHPERQWRGIKRPRHASVMNNSSSSSMLNKFKLEPEFNLGNAVDLLRGLKNWSVTGKRGRKGVSGPAAVALDPVSASGSLLDLVDEDVVQGACGLMSLVFETRIGMLQNSSREL